MLSWYHCQIDVKAAYLYGSLKETVYLEQPKGFVQKGSENKVCLLNKAIYGLHQSGREWNSELDQILTEIGFKKLNWSNCVYHKDFNVVLVVYVDDCVIFGKTKTLLDNVIYSISQKLEITILGKIKYLLGVNFETIGNQVYVHQKTYIERLMLKFSKLPKSVVKLPFKVASILPLKINEREIEENDLMRQFPYRSMIGCLSFLANRSRPDISLAVNIMSQFNNGYSFQHWKYVVDIMNYVFLTKDYMINISDVKNFDLIAYSDADWGSSHTNRHSSSGYLIYFGGIPISWKSSKQKCIALSSMESEFISLTECVKETLWYSRVLNELYLCDRIKPCIFCDNQSAIFFLNNNQENVRTKHIDIKYQFIRKLFNDNLFEIKYISSKKNYSDFLTKPLLQNKFDEIVKQIFTVL